MAQALRSSEKTTRGAKLSRLIVDGGTVVSRQILREHYPTTELLVSALNNHRKTFEDLLFKKKVINQAQWDQLFPSDNSLPNVESFDITLLFILLRNICHKLPAPVQGWNTKPSPLDTSQAANLLRLKYYRNEIYAHASSTAVESADFESHWNSIAAVLVALGFDSSEITRLKVTPFDEEMYLKTLFERAEQDQNTGRNLQKIAVTEEKHRQMLENIKVTQEQIQNAITGKRVGDISYTPDGPSLIGKGPKGTHVYRGKLLSSCQVVAVKRMLGGIFDLSKARDLIKLDHPNIIRCFAAEESEQFVYIALELCDKTLPRCIELGLFANNVLTRRSCLCQVTEAVRYLHDDQGLSHRDIKPGNIFITFPGATSQSRFVLADANASRETDNETFSTKTPVAGGIGWIAPENYQPGTRPSPKADIFSLGCVFYYTLTNMKHPFGDAADMAVCQTNIYAGQQAVLQPNEFVELSRLDGLISNMVMQFPDARPTAADVCTSLLQ